MKTWILWLGLLGAGVAAIWGGSSWFSSADNDVAVEDDLPAELLELSELSELAEPPPVPVKNRLQLNLSLHQPVPLLKTVEQVLTQHVEAAEQVSRSSLELLVTLRLEEVAEDGSRRLGVVYNRVRYREDVAGRSFTYDSTVPATQWPVEALPYQGLVNNGFSFWIDKNHRLLRPVGFADFLKRCVKDVPPEQQQRVLLAFSNAADEGVANFIDDSLGYLPTDPNVGPGDTWEREHRLTKPIPLYLRSRCTLDKLNDQVAEIGITGSIATTKTFGPDESTPANDLRVIVRGGKAVGSCQIDLKTGLPLYSTIRRYVDMEVQLAGGRQFDQQKITTTTIRLFPQQSEASGGNVIQVSGESPPQPPTMP